MNGAIKGRSVFKLTIAAFVRTEDNNVKLQTGGGAQIRIGTLRKRRRGVDRCAEVLGIGRAVLPAGTRTRRFMTSFCLS